MSVRIKICGITSLVDATAAIEAGADALGFMLYEQSSRFITAQNAKAIIRELPDYVTKVGVFVDTDFDTVNHTAETVGLDTLQFHGSETPDFCSKFQQNTIKAFRVKGSESLCQMHHYNTNAWLLDSYVKGSLGGTGEKFNWNLALEAKRLGKPIILAGGLTSDNVRDAINQVDPFCLDVSSGVESAPGIKEASKMTKLITNATNAKGSSIGKDLWS